MSKDLLFDSNKENKENVIPNIINYNNSESKIGNEKDIRTAFRTSYMPKIHSRLNFALERINENDEDNYYSSSKANTHNNNIDKNPQEIIFNLKRKIIELEDQIASLRKKNEILTKDNIQNDSKIQRMSFVSSRRKFAFGLGGENNKNEISELIKEKNDLQEINEKMLNMLTEKELENEDLQENFDKYKNNIKLEIQNYLEIITDLEQKIEIYEENEKKGKNIDDNLEEILKEYNSYKERMEKSINEYIRKEEELNMELDNKENCIQNMKNEIQNLELENIQLQNQSEQKEKDYDNELLNIDIIIKENEKFKNDILLLEEQMQSNEEKNKKIISSKEDEIKILSQDLEYTQKNLNKIKEEKNKEINILKNEISKYNRDINNLIKKNEIIQREDEEIKEKINKIQNKLDRKTKELQDINDSTKKLIENKENMIKQYEDKIDEINKDKNKLIEQNHELLDKIKNMNTNNLGDILNEDENNDEINENNDNNNNYENMLLRTEIKTLKEQLENQAQDLVSLDAMEKEIIRLKMENEKLTKEYKELKDKMNKQKYDIDADNLMHNIKKQYNALRMTTREKTSSNDIKEISFGNKTYYEKQIEALRKMKEDEKKKLLDEMDKLKGDIAMLKIKYLNQNYENETLIIKYKNIIKTINKECKKRGIKLNFNIKS